MPLKRLIWEQEDKLYTPLQLTYGSHKVFAKVRMVDVIAAEDRNLTDEERDYLFKAHFDFVIVNEKYEPIVAFELDGSYHLFDQKQMARDEKKDSICEKARLPLVRVPFEVVNKMKDVSDVFAEAGYSERGGEKKILADLIRGLHEVAANPEFGRFADWLMAHERGRDIVMAYSFSELVEFVNKEGLQGAISNIEAVVSLSDFFEEAFEESGLSQEEWEGLGFSAISCLFRFGLERPRSLGLTQEEYYRTTEWLRLQAAAKYIATKSDESSSPADRLAFVEEMNTVWREALSIVARLKQDCPPAAEPFVAGIRDLANFLEESDGEDINRRLEDIAALNQYLARVRAHVT